MSLVADDWNPRLERHFAREWLAYLMEHRGEWVHPAQAWRTNNEHQLTILRQCAYEATVAWRRLGMVIEGDRRRGYRLVGPDDPPRYLHLR